MKRLKGTLAIYMKQDILTISLLAVIGLGFIGFNFGKTNYEDVFILM